MAGAECCANAPLLDPDSGKGCVVDDFGGLVAYASGSPDSKLAIVFASDIYGFEAPKLRNLVDKVAAAGFYVLVPDFFRGDAYVATKNIPISTWVQSHGPDKGLEDAKRVIAALQGKGVSAIGAVGFCWGGKVVAELAKLGDIKAAVMLHPAFVTVDDIKETKAHLAVLGAEIDNYSPPELVKQFGEVLSVKSEVNGFVKIFPGAPHGWSTRYDASDEGAVKRAEEACQDLLDWFVKHLK